MRIDTGAQLEQIRDSGGYVVLNRQGQLETQSTFMHVMQKVADFFRSMTAGGRETIARRDAALRHAMDVMLRDPRVINASMTVIPRPSGRPAMPPPDLAASFSSVAYSGQKEAPASFMAEVRGMVDAEVPRLFPQLDDETRGEFELEAFKRMKSFLYDADTSGGVDRTVLREIVSDVVKDIAASASSVAEDVSLKASSEKPGASVSVEEKKESSSALSGASSGKAVDPSSFIRASDVEERMFTMAERITSHYFPKMDDMMRTEFTFGVCQEIMTDVLSSLRDKDGNVRAEALCQAVADKVEGLAGEMLKDPGTALHPAPQVVTKPLEELRPEDIGPGVILMQGKNTCFMLSVVNSMMLTEQGRSVLSRCLTKEGTLHIDGEADWDGTSHPGFSRLENSMADVYAAHDKNWKIGEMGMAGEFAALFGLTPVIYAVENGCELYQKKISDHRDIERISRHLNNDRMVILFQNHHYMAVAGTEEGGLILRNSMTGKEEHYPLSSLSEATVEVRAYPGH